MTTDRLSALDASFLTAEKPGFPLHIGGMALFEGGPLLDADGRVRIDDIRRVVLGHLDQLPRFRRRIHDGPFGTLPVWVDDAGFDVRAHVRADRVPPPGDEATMLDTALRLHLEPLPRDRPLWEMVFLDGLADGRVLLVDKVHHALVDGVSGAESLAVLLDPDPGARPGEPAPWTPEPPPSPGQQLVDLLTRVARVPAAVADHLAHLPNWPADLGALGRMFTDLVARERPAPRCSLNVPVGPERRYVLIRQSLPEVKRTAHAVGAKVNDVVLAAVCAGLRELLAGRGELDGLDHLQALVPVSLRPEEERLSLGNKVSGLLASLPVGIADPHERLEAVARYMRERKTSGGAELMGALLGSADWWPPAVLSVVSNLSVHRQPLVNLVVTNVPGPRVPLYLLGARMEEVFPYVPLGGNTSVGVAILSYLDQLDLGITADPVACPDLDRFVEGIERGFAELVGTR